MKPSPTAYRNRLSDERGMSLVELMIALVVLLVVSLALMQTALVSIDANMQNVIREEATTVAARILDEFRGASFDSLADNPGTTTAFANLVARNISDTSGELGENFFTITNTVTVLDAERTALRLDVNVQWDWKGEMYNGTTFSTIRYEPGD